MFHKSLHSNIKCMNIHHMYIYHCEPKLRILLKNFWRKTKAITFQICTKNWNASFGNIQKAYIINLEFMQSKKGWNYFWTLFYRTRSLCCSPGWVSSTHFCIPLCLPVQFENRGSSSFIICKWLVQKQRCRWVFKSGWAKAHPAHPLAAAMMLEWYSNPSSPNTSPIILVSFPNI